MGTDGDPLTGVVGRPGVYHRFSMAGTPRKRARRELDDALAAAEAMEAEAEPDAYPEMPAKRNRGADAAWMAEITAKRMEMAKTDPSKKGGRPRTKLTREEAEELAIETMLPKAMLVLRAQLDSKDERVAQTAALKVLEHVKGKPTQRVEQRNEVSVIRYESAPWTYATGALAEITSESEQILEDDAGTDPETG